MLGRTVREIETSMGAYELAEWRQLCADEVIGDERSDYWHGMMLTTYINAHKAGGSRISISDVLPRCVSDEPSLDDDPRLKNDAG